MFRLTDGRDYFYQWDLNRQVIVEDPNVTEVHFCNRTDDCSLVVEVYADPLDSELKADVPNILLQNDFPIRVYAYCDSYTKVEEVFKVKPRSKPTDYVYTETEVKNYDELVERINNIEGQIEEVVHQYLEENPITVDLTGYATEEYVEIQINDSIEEYDKTITQYVNESIENIPKPDLTGLATEDFVRTEISNIDIPETDLTGYATEDWVNAKGYLTSIPNYYVTDNKLNSKGYVTAETLNNYAHKNDIPTVPTKVSELTNDINYTTKDYVDKAVANAGGGSGGSGIKEVYYIDFRSATENYQDATEDMVAFAESYDAGNDVCLYICDYYSESNGLPTYQVASIHYDNIGEQTFTIYKDSMPIALVAQNMQVGTDTINLSKIDGVWKYKYTNSHECTVATKEYVDNLFANIGTAEGSSY